MVSDSGRVGPSSQASRAAALERLGLTEEDLEVGEEKLREWMAFEVLKPLVAKLDRTHTDVGSAAARLGWAGVQLAPLLDTLAGEQHVGGEWQADGGVLEQQTCHSAEGPLNAAVLLCCKGAGVWGSTVP